jgi:hypothetical protein
MPDGRLKYELRFDKASPVDAFWSLTIYNADDKMLVENPINRYTEQGSAPATRRGGPV